MSACDAAVDQHRQPLVRPRLCGPSRVRAGSLVERVGRVHHRVEQSPESKSRHGLQPPLGDSKSCPERAARPTRTRRRRGGVTPSAIYATFQWPTDRPTRPTGWPSVADVLHASLPGKRTRHQSLSLPLLPPGWPALPAGQAHTQSQQRRETRKTGRAKRVPLGGIAPLYWITRECSTGE